MTSAPYCAIDFGTSNSAVAVPDGAAMRLIELEPGFRTMPTAVFYPGEGARHGHAAPALCEFGRAAIAAYVDGVSRVLTNARRALEARAPVCIVVNDRRDLYPEILRRAGLTLEDRLERHVNRRTGLRSGEYFESVLVCRAV